MKKSKRPQDIHSDENNEWEQKSSEKLKRDNNIPEEIDSHLKLYGKHAWEVKYGEKCPLCDKRIDEYGFCACGSQGD